MESLSIWNFEGAEVRTAMKENEPWWVLADICKVLDIKNNRDAASRLKEDEKDDVGFSDAIGRQQEMTIINEKGLYRLIFRSNKPEAKRFQDWVFGEVLPSIRKTGSYALPKIDKEMLPEACKRSALPLYPESGAPIEGLPCENRHYIQKTFMGQKVWTINDASGEIGLRPYIIMSAWKSGFFTERDCAKLTGGALMRFKEENCGSRLRVSRIIIISASGLAKLCKRYNTVMLGNAISAKRA